MAPFTITSLENYTFDLTGVSASFLWGQNKLFSKPKVLVAHWSFWFSCVYRFLSVLAWQVLLTSIIAEK